MRCDAHVHWWPLSSRPRPGQRIEAACRCPAESLPAPPPRCDRDDRRDCGLSTCTVWALPAGPFGRLEAGGTGDL